MATTTNFGWETPDDTDLVKDGALAMRTLGNAIDASLVDLKGGTTGQVLSKASNTDLDYTWVTQDDANAIQNAIVDAKGDLITATAADTPSRIAVGNNGETLVADSSASTGLRWQTGVNTNGTINGGFDVWQRGTSFTAASVYTADRWFTDGGSGRTFSQINTSDTTNLPTLPLGLRMQRNSGQTWSGAFGVISSFENLQSQPYLGQTVTLSFWARKGANFSGTSDAFSVRLYAGTGTNQRRDFSNAFTGETQPVAGSVTLTSSWQRFSFTATVGATMTQIAVGLYYSATGTAGAADYADITGVQLELGSVPTAFKRAGGTLAGEIAACKYYYRRRSTNTSFVILYGGGVAGSTTYVALPCDLTTMRTTPTAIDFSNIQAYKYTNDTGYSSGTFALGGSYDSGALISYTHGSAVFTANDAIALRAGSGGGYIGFSAEL